MFDGLSKLRYLYLSQNIINNIDADAFSPLRQLHTLDLRKNQITGLKFKYFVNQKEFRKLDVRENPLQCSCQLYNVCKKLEESLPWQFIVFPGKCDKDVDLHRLVYTTPKIKARKQMGCYE